MGAVRTTRPPPARLGLFLAPQSARPNCRCLTLNIPLSDRAGASKIVCVDDGKVVPWCVEPSIWWLPGCTTMASGMRARQLFRLTSALTVLWVSGLTVSVSALAQQKTGPGITGDDALTWHGITLYGVIDIGLQYDTHSAPFTPYRPAASGNIVRQNGSQSVTGLTPSNMGQSRVGLQGVEALNEEWSAVFQVETFFNPQSGEIADSLKSLAVNNGRPLAKQSVGVDGSSAGQAFQTAYVGFRSARFGTLTFGRQANAAVGRQHQVRPQLRRQCIWPASGRRTRIPVPAAVKITGSTRRRSTF